MRMQITNCTAALGNPATESACMHRLGAAAACCDDGGPERDLNRAVDRLEVSPCI